MESTGDESDHGSIVELEPPPKSSPPCIFIEEEEDVILNLTFSSKKKDETAADGNHIQHGMKTFRFFPKPTAPAAAAKPSENNSPSHWTLDMIKYYDDNWGDEQDFNIYKILQNMDKNPSLWKVSDKDMLSKYKCKDKKKQLVKCFNCCQFGHVAVRCPDPVKIQKCYMCGGAGHEPKQCPNSKCLNCGSQSRSFTDMCNKCIKQSGKTCSRCKVQGHYFINCSDHWRKFHITTCLQIKIPNKSNLHKPKSEQWCCNCGNHGHIEIKCQSEKGCKFSKTLPFVASYKDLFFKPSENAFESDDGKMAEKKVNRRRYFEETEDNVSLSSGTLTCNPQDEIIFVYDNAKDTVESKKSFNRNCEMQNQDSRQRRRKRRGKFTSKGKKIQNRSRYNDMKQWRAMFQCQKRKGVTSC